MSSSQSAVLVAFPTIGTTRIWECTRTCWSLRSHIGTAANRGEEFAVELRCIRTNEPHVRVNDYRLYFCDNFYSLDRTQGEVVGRCLGIRRDLPNHPEAKHKFKIWNWQGSPGAQVGRILFHLGLCLHLLTSWIRSVALHPTCPRAEEQPHPRNIRLHGRINVATAPA